MKTNLLDQWPEQLLEFEAAAAIPVVADDKFEGERRVLDNVVHVDHLGLDLTLQSRSEEVEQEELLALVAAVIVEAEDECLQELGRRLRHREHKP